jgi:hypothetical protein
VPAIAAHLALLDAADLLSNLALATGLQSAGIVHGRMAPGGARCPPSSASA